MSSCRSMAPQWVVEEVRIGGRCSDKLIPLSHGPICSCVGYWNALTLVGNPRYTQISRSAPIFPRYYCVFGRNLLQKTSRF